MQFRAADLIYQYELGKLSQGLLIQITLSII